MRASGAKNAALPILAAGLLTDAPVTIRNVPKLHDVTTMIRLLSRMGVVVTTGEGGACRVDAGKLGEAVAPYDLVKTMRASIPASPLLRVTARRGCRCLALRDRRAPVNLRGQARGHGRQHLDRGRIYPPGWTPGRRADRAGHRDGHALKTS